MIKKYFAMTIIAASVSLAACSDDDDDEPAATPGTEMGGEEMGGEEMGGEEMEPPAPAGGEGTAYDIISGSEDHTILKGLIDDLSLAATLDSADAAAVFTVFAPNDAAFAAYNDAVAAGLATEDDDSDDLPALDSFAPNQVTRILLNHVVSGSVATLEDGAVLDTLAAANTDVDPALAAQTLTASINAEGATSVSAIGGEPVAVI
ncbi:MAG: fasciclin domain-containing protein, partial [Granulosicoccus sp.]